MIDKGGYCKTNLLRIWEQNNLIIIVGTEIETAIEVTDANKYNTGYAELCERKVCLCLALLGAGYLKPRYIIQLRVCHRR